ncbi:MAG: endonuclease/exonuclease/phosphatase family protein [Patescibacteria group bacterium]
MKLKTVQWNIGGGKTRKPSDDPMNVLSYSNEALSDIVIILKKLNPDIITIQESHSDAKVVQSKVIGDALGLSHIANDIYDKSHLEDDQWLSQAIISRFPIESHSFNFFYNPKLEMIGPKR